MSREQKVGAYRTTGHTRAPIQWGKRKGVMVCPVCRRPIRGGVWAVWHSPGRHEPVFRHAYAEDCKPLIDSRPAGSR